jgi:hypothetical protein
MCVFKSVKVRFVSLAAVVSFVSRDLVAKDPWIATLSTGIWED